MLILMGFTICVALAQVKYYTPDPSIILPGAMLSNEQHDERYRALGKGLYVLHWKAKEGELLYIGSQHVNDPTDPQYVLIEQYWDAFNPEIVFFEGRGPGLAKTRDEAIQRNGEPGLARFLAQRDQREAMSFEPTIEAEMSPLLAKFDKRDIALKLTITGYFSDRRGRSVPDWQVEMNLKRRQVQYGLGEVFSDLKAMDGYWHEKYPHLSDWRTAPESVVWPGVEHTALNAIANISNKIRDEHMMRTVIDLMNKGKRALIIVGRSHVLNQEPVLERALSPTELVFSTKKPWKKQDPASHERETGSNSGAFEGASSQPCDKRSPRSSPYTCRPHGVG